MKKIIPFISVNLVFCSLLVDAQTTEIVNIPNDRITALEERLSFLENLNEKLLLQ